MSMSIKFGSQARGDNDTISDIDILEIIRPQQKIQVKQNVHYYTKRRLHSLKKINSLFLVHLREEGEIIKDDSDWLKNFLEEIPNYKASNDSIKVVQNYLEILLSIIPTNKQKLWWFDCIYVFLRDYLIKYNSQYSIYSFSPFKFAKPINNRTEDLTELVLKFRKLKSLYRNNFTDVIEDEFIMKTKQKLSDALGLTYSENTLVNLFLSSSNLESYFQLRLIEGLSLNNDITIVDDILIKFIKSPHAYNWEIKNCDLKSKINIVQNK